MEKDEIEIINEAINYFRNKQNEILKENQKKYKEQERCQDQENDKPKS